MTDFTLLIVAFIAFTFVLLTFWIEYRLSDCEYGGACNGKDNWVLKIIRTTFIETKEKRVRKESDICDI